MNDVELIDRLEQELTALPRWPEVRRVVSAKVDPSLAKNELLVIPRPSPGGEAVEALRIVVEHLLLPRMPP